MKWSNKYYAHFIFLVALICCKKEDTHNNNNGSGGVINTIDTTVVITSLTPQTVKYNARAVLFGKNFLTDTINQTISVNGIKIPITIATKDSLVLKIPAGLTNGNIVLNKQGKLYTGPAITYNRAWWVNTFAGSRTKGYADGQGLDAKFNFPSYLAIDAADNLYVADAGNYRIRKITKNGLVTTIGGNGISGTTDGSALSAKITPSGIAVGINGDVFFSDQNCIRKISGGVITTVAGNKDFTGLTDGQGNSARLNPSAMTNDASGNIYFIQFAAAYTNSPVCIRKMTYSGSVSTISKSSLLASLPRGITFNAGNLYITNEWKFSILKVVIATGSTSVYAGINGSIAASCVDGLTTENTIGYGNGITSLPNGDLFFINASCNSIKKVSIAGIVSTFASAEDVVTNPSNYHAGFTGYQDGEAWQARFYFPRDIIAASNGDLFVADTENNCIRKISYY